MTNEGYESRRGRRCGPRDGRRLGGGRFNGTGPLGGTEDCVLYKQNKKEVK